MSDTLTLVPGTSPGHDRASTAADRTATSALAETLRRLHVRGAIFLHAEYTEPWAYESMSAEDATDVLAPGMDRVVLFHLVAAGRCWIEVDGTRLWASRGDVIVLPYGDRHRMGGATPADLVPIGRLLQPPPWKAMPMIRHGAGGPATQVVCGYLACDDPLFDPRLDALPPVFVVSPPEGPAREWVRAGVEYAAAQTAPTPRRLEAPTNLPELLLGEVLRLHLASAPGLDTGWLSAIRDPVLAPALAAIHGAPDKPWDLAGLAREAAVSVSLLDGRFREVLGLAPIRYLSAWRMHVAVTLLRSTELGVATVARRVGYTSEEAFSRAFKREVGQAPSAWRAGLRRATAR